MKIRANKQKGQAILEMALILPVFVLVALGMADVVWALERTANLEYIVNESARCEALNGIPCTMQSYHDYALSLATNLRMNDHNLTIQTPACVEGVSCTVIGTYRFQPIGVYFPHITIQRTGTAVLPPL